MKNDARHRLWVPALSCVVFFFMIIAVAIGSQNLLSDMEGEIYQREQAVAFAESIFSKANIFLSIVAAVGAAICGLEGFSYLFSRKKTDYFHSLPMRREQLFFLRWINGLLFYLLPCLFCMVACTILLGGSGLTSHQYYQNMWIGFLYNLIIFLLVYHTAILAVMLTGQILVAAAGFCILFLYTVIIQYLVPAYVQVFYSTYDVANMNVLGILRYLSPANVWITLADEGRPFHWLIALALAAALAAAAFVLYRIRPSEAAGNSIAFPVSRPVIRILLVIPFSLYVALAFHKTASIGPAFWSIFGLAVFGLLLHALIEIIYDFDIRSALHHWPQLVGCFLAGLAFLGFFLADPLRLDMRLPAMNNVSAIYLDLPLDNEIPYFRGEDLFRETALANYSPTGTTSYRLEHTALTGENLPLAYNLIRSGQKASESEEQDGRLRQANLNVAFRKKDGSMEYRLFDLWLPSNRDALAEVYETKELRENHFQIETLPSDIYTSMKITDAALNDFTRNFSESEIREFVDIYKRELLEQTTGDVVTYPSIGQLSLTAKSGVTLSLYQIYSSFTDTIQWLEDHTIDLHAWTTRLTPVSMTIKPNRQTVEDYYTDGYYMNGEYYEPEMAEMDGAYAEEIDAGAFPATETSPDTSSARTDPNQIFPATVTDPDHIRRLLPHLYNRGMYLSNEILRTDQETGYAVTVSFQDPDTASLVDVNFICPADFDMEDYLSEGEKQNENQ